MTLNQCTFMGRLGSDPQLETVGQSGTPRVRVSVATRKWHPTKKVEIMHWHRCVVWGKQAEALAQRGSKGDTVVVVSEHCPEPYTDKKTGEQRTSDEFRVLSWSFAVPPKSAGQQRAPQQSQQQPRQQYQQRAPQQQYDGPPQGGYQNDDLPF